jgi:hypothetical protein
VKTGPRSTRATNSLSSKRELGDAHSPIERATFMGVMGSAQSRPRVKSKSLHQLDCSALHLEDLAISQRANYTRWLDISYPLRMEEADSFTHFFNAMSIHLRLAAMVTSPEKRPQDAGKGLIADWPRLDLDSVDGNQPSSYGPCSVLPRLANDTEFHTRH